MAMTSGPPPRRLTWLILIGLVILLGVYLRLEAVRITEVDNPFRPDSADYTAYAYNLERHGIYSRDKSTIFSNSAAPQPDALRAPGYPLLLSLLVSDNIKAFLTRSVYSQALISAATLILVLLLSCMCMKRWYALATTFLAAISPHLVIMNTYVLSETVFTFWLVLLILTLARAQSKESAALWITGSVLLAIATLTRPTITYFILPLVLFAWLTTRTERRKTISISVLLIFLAITSAWSIRNQLATGQTSDPKLVINALHHGMYPDFMYQGKTESYGYPYKFDPESNSISESVGSAVSHILERMSTQPVKYLGWYLSKPAWFFQWDQVQGNDIFIYPALISPYYAEGSIFDFTSVLMHKTHSILVLLSLVGMIAGLLPSSISLLSDGQRKAVLLVSLVYIYYILVHIVVAPFPRYSIPLRPLTYILSLVAVYSTINNLKYRLANHGREQ